MFLVLFHQGRELTFSTSFDLIRELLEVVELRDLGFSRLRLGLIKFFRVHDQELDYIT